MKGLLFAPFQTKCEANENITPVGKSKANWSFCLKRSFQRQRKRISLIGLISLMGKPTYFATLLAVDSKRQTPQAATRY